MSQHTPHLQQGMIDRITVSHALSQLDAGPYSIGQVQAALHGSGIAFRRCSGVGLRGRYIVGHVGLGEDGDVGHVVGVCVDNDKLRVFDCEAEDKERVYRKEDGLPLPSGGKTYCWELVVEDSESTEPRTGEPVLPGGGAIINGRALDSWHPGSRVKGQES